MRSRSTHATIYCRAADGKGPVNLSLNVDAHGKSLSYLLLALPVEVTLYNSEASS